MKMRDISDDENNGSLREIQAYWGEVEGANFHPQCFREVHDNTLPQRVFIPQICIKGLQVAMGFSINGYLAQRLHSFLDCL